MIDVNLTIKRTITSFINSKIEEDTIKCPKCRRNFHMRNFHDGRLSTGWCETSYCITFAEYWSDLDKKR